MELSILWKAIPETAAGRTTIPLGTMRSWDMECLRIEHLTLISAFRGWYQGRFFYLTHIGVGYKDQLSQKSTEIPSRELKNKELCVIIPLAFYKEHLPIVAPRSSRGGRL